jgi:hypothetical protein
VNDCDQASDKNNVFHACSDGNDFNAKVSRDKNQDLFEARVLEKVPGHLIFTRLQNICAPRHCDMP